MVQAGVQVKFQFDGEQLAGEVTQLVNGGQSAMVRVPETEETQYPRMFSVPVDILAVDTAATVRVWFDSYRDMTLYAKSIERNQTLRDAGKVHNLPTVQRAYGLAEDRARGIERWAEVTGYELPSYEILKAYCEG